MDLKSGAEQAVGDINELLFLEKANDFWKKVARAERIVITSHINPDGDAIGSMLGLFHLLASLGKDPMMFCSDPAPPHLSFLSGSELIFVNSNRFPWNDHPIDLLIILDCSAPVRLGSSAFLIEHAEDVCLIDHHVDPEDFPGMHIVDEKASSTAEILFRLIVKGDFAIPKEAALALYVAIMTDTGSFRYGNTSAYSFRAAAELVQAGSIDVRQIGVEIFARESLPRLQLRGCVFDRVSFSDGVIFSCVTAEMLKKCGAAFPDAEAIIDDLALCRTADVAIMLWEVEPDTVRVQVRSVDKVNVLPIAQALGGGGHDKAAGCRIKGISLDEAEERVLHEARKVLRPQVKQPVRTG